MSESESKFKLSRGAGPPRSFAIIGELSREAAGVPGTVVRRRLGSTASLRLLLLRLQAWAASGRTRPGVSRGRGLSVSCALPRCTRARRPPPPSPPPPPPPPPRTRH